MLKTKLLTVTNVFVSKCLPRNTANIFLQMLRESVAYKHYRSTLWKTLYNNDACHGYQLITSIIFYGHL